MRLTLRTLLAWIDGVLPAPQQEEIGSKVGASAVAPRLVDRIREVTARPGLTAPRVDGRGLAEDANTVAEFLDNALPGERLEAFERVCIESDIHLAEAADCHALLAELARDPAAIPPIDGRLRQRLLDRLADDATPPAAGDSHEEAAALVRAVREATDRPARPERPPRAAASLAAWLSAGVAVLLLVALGFLLRRSLLTTAKPREVAAAAPRVPAAVPMPTAPEARDEPSPPGPTAGDGNAVAQTPVAETPVAEAPAAAGPPDAPAAIAGPREPAPSEPAPSEPAGSRPPADGAAAAIGVAIPLPAMELADADAEGIDADVPEAPAAAADQPALPPGMVAEGGALLHRVRVGDEARWEPLATGDPLAAVEELVAPEHAYPRLVRGDVSFRLQPRTRAVLSVDRDGTPRLEVVFGGAIAWTEAAEAAVGISAGGLSGVAALGPRQPLGVAVELLRNEGDDPAVVPPGRRARMHVLGGSSWRQTELDGGPPGRPLAGLAAEQPLPPQGCLEWESADPGTARLLPAAASPQWMGRTAAVSRLERNAGSWLAAGLVAGEPAAESLRPLAADRRVENRMAAAATLALLGDYDELVGLLCEDRPGRKLTDRQWDELRRATVPLALARGANAAAKLRQSFAARGTPGRADELFSLARGLTPAEPAADVVDSLEDDALAIRRFAFQALATAFPDEEPWRLDYRPDRPKSLNEQGVGRWRRRVAEVAAAVGPEPTP